MKVSHWMTKEPKTVTPAATLSEAAALMSSLHVNHLPVVEGDLLVGILSDTDMRKATHDGPEGSTNAGATLVRDAMRHDVWTVSLDDSLEDALLIIHRRKFGCLPVVDKGRLVGILTKMDLLSAVIEELNIGDVGLRMDVRFPPALPRFEAMQEVFRELGVGLKSCRLTPDPETGKMVAMLRLDTFNGPLVKAALRASKFEVVD